MRWKFRWLWAIAVVGSGGLGDPALGLAQEAEQCPTFPPTQESNPNSDVRYLADDRLAGREVASQGARCAAAFLETRFRGLGLKPAYDAFQVPFAVRNGYQAGSHNTLEVDGTPSVMGETWAPFGFTSTGMVEAPVIPVQVASLGPDLRAGLAHAGVADKVILARSHGGQGDPHAFASAAGAAGALGVLWLIEGDLPDMATESRPAVPIPTAAVTAALGTTLESTANQSVTLMTQVERREAEARNVVALVPGRHWPDGEVVVVGAHYDHLGLGGQGSLAPDDYGTIHNGADDNASGTAALLEVARRLSDLPPAERSVVLVAFTGEERGLWGSAQFVEEPPVPVERMTAMINMDMVGRLESGGLTIFGVGTAEEWEDLLEDASADLDDPPGFTGAPDGYGPSDHSSFYGRDVPVLHFFTNTHTEYHRPTDDWALIDSDGVTTVASFVTAAVERLVSGPGLTLIRGAGAPVVATSPDDEPAPSRGYGAYLGTIPDMSASVETGVRLTGVREGSPAAAAGLEAGDVLVAMAGRELTDLYAFTYVLRDHEPGDEVEIQYLRNGAKHTVSAVLGRR